MCLERSSAKQLIGKSIPVDADRKSQSFILRLMLCILTTRQRKMLVQSQDLARAIDKLVVSALAGIEDLFHFSMKGSQVLSRATRF